MNYLQSIRLLAKIYEAVVSAACVSVAATAKLLPARYLYPFFPPAYVS
ncbi:hypothetical protein [Hymenobacter koreensis]